MEFKKPCEIRFSNSRYVGHCDEYSKPSGIGFYEYENGDFEIGFFENLALNGYGCSYKNGVYSAGNWKNGKLNGFGLRKNANGTTTMGHFLDDVVHGIAFENVNDDDHISYCCEYVNGRKEGRGIILFLDSKQLAFAEFSGDRIINISIVDFDFSPHLELPKVRVPDFKIAPDFNESFSLSQDLTGQHEYYAWFRDNGLMFYTSPGYVFIGNEVCHEMFGISVHINPHDISFYDKDGSSKQKRHVFDVNKDKCSLYDIYTGEWKNECWPKLEYSYGSMVLSLKSGKGCFLNIDRDFNIELKRRGRGTNSDLKIPFTLSRAAVSGDVVGLDDSIDWFDL